MFFSQKNQLDQSDFSLSEQAERWSCRLRELYLTRLCPAVAWSSPVVLSYLSPICLYHRWLIFCPVHKRTTAKVEGCSAELIPMHQYKTWWLPDWLSGDQWPKMDKHWLFSKRSV